MKRVEKILAIGIVIASIMKLIFINGSDIIILWSTLILACLYYPLGFLFFNQIRLRNIFNKATYKEVSATKIILAIVVGLGLSIIIVGSLFKILYFSGAEEMLLIGNIITAVLFIYYLVLFIKNKDTISKFILWRVSIVGVIGILLLFTPTLSIVKLQYRNHPNYIQAYINYTENPSNEDLYKKLELEKNRITLTEEEFKAYKDALKEEENN